MDRVGAFVVFMLVAVVAGGFALHQHNKARSAAAIEAAHAELLAWDAADRAAIVQSAQRMADMAACEKSLPQHKCAELFVALDCYYGRWECPGACDAGSYLPELDPERQTIAASRDKP